MRGCIAGQTECESDSHGLVRARLGHRHADDLHAGLYAGDGQSSRRATQRITFLEIHRPSNEAKHRRAEAGI